MIDLKKLLFVLSFVIIISTMNVYGGSRNKIEESGSIKNAGEAVNANLVIKPNNQVATGAYIEIEFENAVVFSSNVINGSGNANEIGYNGKSTGYQYVGYKNYKWNGSDNFIEAMSEGSISKVPYKITRVNDYNIKVSLCNIPSEYADKSLSNFNNSADAPYYSIPLPVYVKEDGYVRIKITGKTNDTSLSYGSYVFNQESTEKSTEEETVAAEVETETTTAKTYLSNNVQVSIGSKIMIVNGVSQTIDAAPYIQAGTWATLVPLRAVSIAVTDGYSGKGSVNIVSWDADTKTAIVNCGDNVISFTAGSNIMTVNGEEKYIENGVKAEISDGRMFVPFRVLGEELGAEVNWIAETKTAVYN